MEQILNTEQIKEEFAIRKKRQKYYTMPFVFLIIASIVVRKNPEINILNISSEYFAWTILFVAAGLIIFSIKNWRCPACNKYLGKSMNLDFCPKCGVKFKE